MTKAEAIGIMENYINHFEDGAILYEALKMANKALKDEDAMLEKVLQIINLASDENRNHIGVVQNDDMDKAYSIVWERVLRLKGGKE